MMVVTANADLVAFQRGRRPWEGTELWDSTRCLSLGPKSLCMGQRSDAHSKTSSRSWALILGGPLLFSRPLPCQVTIPNTRLLASTSVHLVRLFQDQPSSLYAMRTYLFFPLSNPLRSSRVRSRLS